MTDYPAAHSMDAYWFAIDERGQVAVFDTAEQGPAPEGTEWEDDHLEELVGLLPSVRRTWPRQGEASVLGLFYYGFDDASDPVAPFARGEPPAAPLHADQLPPRLRDECVRLALRFDLAERVQPLELIPCFCCSDCVAYLAADGVTVRPRPGCEAHFADYVRRLRQERPEEAANYRFEGPAE
jgi:hypothetical protein